MADEETESWEDVDEDELVRRVINRQEQLTKDVNKQDREPAPVYNTVSEVGPTTIQYSSNEPAYVASVKILKRPELTDERALKSNTQPVQQKTLAQREADYASARARIMGQPEPNQSRHRQNSLESSSQRLNNKKEVEQRSIARKQ